MSKAHGPAPAALVRRRCGPLLDNLDTEMVAGIVRTCRTFRSVAGHCCPVVGRGLAPRPLHGHDQSSMQRAVGCRCARRPVTPAASGGPEPRFPQKPQFGITASLIHSVQCRALPPVRWLFEVHCARVLRAGRIQRTSQTGERLHPQT